MRGLWTALRAAVVVAMGTIAVAQPAPDDPQLASPGAYAVGVRQIVLVEPNQPDLAQVPSRIAYHDRTIPLTIWYPASKTANGFRAHYRMNKPGAFASGGRTGMAVASAKPVKGQAFPLVVLSHGYRNWATGYSDLAEHLASRGYVVASIDHRDADPSNGIPSTASFGMTLVSRSADQRFVIAELARLGSSGPLAGVYDAGNIALIGYSMGGFGALVTAGAGLDPDSRLFKIVPDRLLADYAEGAPLERRGAPPGVKAVVAFAPWGGLPSLRAWRGSSLAAVSTPMLVVAGDHDDVSGYAEGIHWLYDAAVHSDRHLLVYQNAHHNIVGDGVAGIARPGFEMVERLEEPVWRRDRILAINRHFVTAFLDGLLKHDARHAAFLTVPTPKAADGVWPLPDNASVGARFAGSDSASSGYWPGFQRRWAIGLELYHDAPTGTQKP